MFSCVWLHFKKNFGKYFLMFGCILENTIENTFFSCCSHFLTFSQLPNKRIMSFIPKNSNKTQKDSIFSRWDRDRDRSDLDRRDRDRNLADFDDRDRRRSAQFRWPARSRSWCVGVGGSGAVKAWRRSEGLTEQCVCEGLVRVWGARACERGEETIWSENNDWN